VITSLLEMQARQTADRQALSSLFEARNRIAAIAAIHELLTVTLQQEDGHLRRQVKDSGVGLPSEFNERRPTTLGVQLVHMLGGTVAFDSARGTSVAVRVPIQAKTS